MFAPSDLTRCRSLPHSRPYLFAVFVTLLHYLSLVALVTLIVLFVIRPRDSLVTPVIASLGACGVTWFAGFLRRRSVRCPLCKGTPLLDSRAARHVKARRFPPFNYGTTAVLGIIFFQRFRCMYCGTPYDLLKEKSTQR